MTVGEMFEKHGFKKADVEAQKEKSISWYSKCYVILDLWEHPIQEVPDSYRTQIGYAFDDLVEERNEEIKSGKRPVTVHVKKRD